MANKFGFKGNVVEMGLRMKAVSKMGNFMKQFKFGISIEPYEKWVKEYNEKMDRIDEYNSIEDFQNDIELFLENDIPVVKQEWARG